MINLEKEIEKELMKKSMSHHLKFKIKKIKIRYFHRSEILKLYSKYSRPHLVVLAYPIRFFIQLFQNFSHSPINRKNEKKNQKF